MIRTPTKWVCNHKLRHIRTRAQVSSVQLLMVYNIQQVSQVVAHLLSAIYVQCYKSVEKVLQGYGCGIVGRMVASNTRSLGFESWQI